MLAPSPRYIRSADGQRAYNAVYTIMNEYGELLAEWLTNSQAPGELDALIKALKARFPEGEGVEMLWLDHHQLGGPFKEHFPSLQHILVDVFHLMQRWVRCMPKDWPLTGQLMARLSLAFFQLHEEDVELYRQHALRNLGMTQQQLQQHWAEQPMWYYKQDFIRKSVWHGQPSVLKRKLGEVMDWIRALGAATEGSPPPAEAVQKAAEIYANQCKLVDDGHVIGEPCQA